MSKLDVNRVRDLLQDFAFQELFIELGWNNPGQKRPESISLADETFTYKGVAVLGGIEAFEVKTASGVIPTRPVQLAVSKEIAKARFEHVLIFIDDKRTQSVWFWVKRDGKKRHPREHHFFKGQPGDLFISKIASMSVDLSELDDSGQLPLLQAEKRVRRALDIERVIKRFFKDYDEQRVKFTELIGGISDDKDRRWYASVLLNRLMFIYFLQGKLFIDGGDENYLENKLAQSKLRGPDRFFSEFLQALFFEAFAKPEEKRSPIARELTGNVKYLNGGLFLPHRLEQRYEISIPDEAFENLLRLDEPKGLFTRYSWNLNDIPGESDDNINPDVLGYIFEKYINQKEFGAYYTRPEITEYLCEQTIYRLILDRTNEPNVEGLAPGKTFESVPELLIRLDKTMARRLLHDILPDLTILDPAVGSGAFLVAALKTLITVYSAVIGWLKFHDDAWLSEHLRTKMKTDLSRVQYAIKKAIITDNLYGVDLMEEATEIAKLRLFMTLVASAHTVDDLEPLPNIDFNILTGNSLIGLMRVEDAEFEAKQIKQSSLFAPSKTYRQILDERNLKVDQYRHASGYVDDLAFLRDEVQRIEQAARPVLGALLAQKCEDLGVRFDEATWDEGKRVAGRPMRRAVATEDFDNPEDPELGLKPFHWGFEFDRILHQRGGFDAIITNPPWEVIQEDQKEFASIRFDGSIRKNKLTTTEWDALWLQFMSDKKKREEWLTHVSGLNLLKSYFRKAPEFSAQLSIIEGRNESGKLNLFSLFTERSFRLLRSGGLCGIVIPSGFYSDLGCTGLRRLIFEEASVTGIFGFENRKTVFEGVDSRFKFNLLTFARKGSSDRFWAAFMRHDVADLQEFRSSVGLELTIEQIRAISPNKLSIPEYRSQTDIDIGLKLSGHPSICDGDAPEWYLDLNQEINSSIGKRAARPLKSSDEVAICQGESIHQFVFPFKPVAGFVGAAEARELVLKKRAASNAIPPYFNYRISHRRIARSTDTRTLIATIIPPNVACLDTAMVHRNEVGASDLLYALSIMNSFVIDYLLRLSVDDHCDRHFMNDIGIPRLSTKDGVYRSLVRRACRLVCTAEPFAGLWIAVDAEIGTDIVANLSPRTGRSWSASDAASSSHERSVLRSELDAIVAHLYGLTEEEFRHVLSTFPLVDPGVRDAALAAYRSVSAGRIQ